MDKEVVNKMLEAIENGKKGKKINFDSLDINDVELK